MINKITGYQSSDNAVHNTLEAAQKAEIRILFHTADDTRNALWTASEIADLVHSNADKFIDILTMKPNSLPKARKINGGTKKRTPKHIAEQHALPLEAQ